MARPLIPMTGGIPMPTASDSGKVLTVGETGKYGLAAVPSELPASAAVDEGKVLTVNSSGAPAWANIPTELPASAAVDEGKVLTVNSSGAPAWATPSGGGGAFVVHATLNGETVTVDKTPAQIRQAFSTGLICYAIITDNVGDVVRNHILPLSFCATDIVRFSALESLDRSVALAIDESVADPEWEYQGMDIAEAT